MPKIVDKQEKRTEIAQAALKVFARDGVVKTKMADIAREAGIGKGTIYEYFESKEMLFAEVYNQFFHHMEDQFTDLLDQDLDPVEKILSIGQITTAHFTEENLEFVTIMMDFWAEGVRTKSEEMLEIINLDGMYQEFRDILSRILLQAIEEKKIRPVDTRLAAATLIGIIDGLFLQWLLKPKLMNPAKDIPRALDIFLQGLLIH